MGKIEKATNIIALVLAIVPLYFQLFPKAQTPESIMFFGAIILLVVIIFAVNYLWDIIRVRITQIDENTKNIKRLENEFKFRKMISSLDKRLSIIESKKGSTDPRIIMIAFLVILVILYLRSIGLF